jgi:hypothetical protein
VTCREVSEPCKTLSSLYIFVECLSVELDLKLCCENTLTVLLFNKSNSVFCLFFIAYNLSTVMHLSIKWRLFFFSLKMIAVPITFALMFWTQLTWSVSLNWQIFLLLSHFLCHFNTVQIELNPCNMYMCVVYGRSIQITIIITNNTNTTTPSSSSSQWGRPLTDLFWFPDWIAKLFLNCWSVTWFCIVMF